MSQVILISDDHVINSLYEVNLRVYVATNVTIKSSIEEALSLLEQSPNIDAIICFRKLTNDGLDINALMQAISGKELQTPVILLGGGEEFTNTILIKNRYDIRSLLQAVAKILEITAKDMASLEVSEYFPIPLKLFGRILKTDCDIYFRNKVNDFEFEYLKIIEKDSAIERDTLRKYLKQGVEHLYIDSKLRVQFISLASGAIVGELERDDISEQEKLEITQQGMNLVAEEVFDSEKISESMAIISRACIKSIKKIIKDVPKLKKLLAMLLENKADYVYKHSIIATYIATEILKKISWGSDEQASKVSFSFFFHDIYLIPVLKKYPHIMQEEDLLEDENLDPKDKKILMNHAKKAGQLMKSFPKCPMGADMIMTQHHGMMSGEGFAESFKEDISPLSKVMIVSEEVANHLIGLSSLKGNRIKLEKEKILGVLIRKYRTHTYQKVVNAFKEVEF